MKMVLDNHDVRDAVMRAYGKGMWDNMQKYVTDNENPATLRANSGFDRLMRGLQHNASLTFLGLSMKTAMKQIPSSLYYMFRSNPVYMIKGMLDIAFNAKNTLEAIRQVDPLSIDFRQTEYELYNWAQEAKTKVGRAKQYLDDKAMIMIRAMDRAAVMIGYQAVFRYAQEKMDMSAVDAANYARNHTQITQPSGDKGILPALYRHKAGWDLLLMFTQQTTKIFNMLTYEFPQLLKRGDLRAYEQAGYLLGAVAIAQSMIWAINNRRLPKDEDDWGDMLGLSTLAYIPIIGKQLLSAIHGFNNETAITAEFAKTGKELYEDAKALVEGDAPEYDMEAYLKALSLAVGGYFQGPKNIYGAISQRDIATFFLGGPWDEDRHEHDSQGYYRGRF
jgi:hypothetical protein